MWRLVLLGLLLCAAPAAAQQRTVVVPAGSSVVIAPRGQAQPPLAMTPATRTRRAVPRPLPDLDEEDTLPLGAGGVALLPMIAAAVAAATMGGGNGTAPTATVRTTR